MSNPINIVIIGGNFSGSAISQHIFKHITPFSTTRPVKVTIISPSTKFYWTLGAPRGILNKPELLKPETLQEDIVQSFTKVYGPQGETWEFLEAWARNVDVNNKTVTIEPVVDNIKTSLVPYDHLIIASGTRNHNPFQTPKSTSREDQLDIVAPFKPHGTTEETITALKSWGQKIAEANTILLVGAGPTGVETTGEIQFAYPNKKIILVTSDNILPMLQPRISLTAKTMLEKLGVDVRTNTKVSSVNPAPYGKSVEVVLSTGETIPVDLFIPTLGQVPNTEFLPKDLLDNRGFVKTTKYFSSPNKPDIWAIGDVTEFDGDRQSATIPAQVQVLTYNLKRAVLEEGAIVGQGAGWSEYAPSTDVMMFVPVGRKQGVGQFKTWKVWSFLVWLVKGRDFMVSWMSASINGGTVAKKLKRVELKN